MDETAAIGRRMKIRQAASIVFALVALLPLLLLVSLLARANLLDQTEAQVGLALALLVAVLGFVVFRRMLGQVTRLAQGLQGLQAGGPRVMDLAQTGVPALGEVAEIGEVALAFHRMLDDLRGATQRLEDLVFKLGALNETVELAARIPKIDDLLTLVLQTTMRTVRANAGSIMLVDDERRVLRPVVASGGGDVAAAAEVPLGEGVEGRVAALGESVVVDHVEADPRLSGSAMARQGGAFVCLPIRGGDRVIGVINMVKRRESAGVDLRSQPFTGTDLQFLNALMTYIGYAVANARLLEDAQRSAGQLRRALDDLKTTQDELVRGETLRAIGQLSSGMVHHLNNLFAVMLGRIELVMPRVSDPAVQQSLEVVRRVAQEGAEVARRVERFTRLQPPVELMPLNLAELAREVAELGRVRIQNVADLRRIEIAHEGGATPPVHGEPLALREVLVNLVVNAVEAMPEGGRVSVRTWADHDGVHCAVTDTGVGMSDETRRRVLEPFFTTKGPRSTGLGLSVAYGTIERHGGSLSIDSAEGKGTTVTVTLPVVRPEAPVPVGG
jgi:signal transduction histidine kinase